MPTTRSGRITGRVSSTTSITSPDLAWRQANQVVQGADLEIDRPIVEEASDESSSSPYMANQQAINAGRTGTSASGDEAAGDQITTNAMQLEMLKALKDAREGQGLMMSMMTEIQKQQEEMKNFRQQLLQVPGFQAIFPGNPSAPRSEANNNRNIHGMPPTTIPIILEPLNSGEIPRPQMETGATIQSQPIIIPPISQAQTPIIQSQNQRSNQQSQPMQIPPDASIHQPFSLPHTPLTHPFIQTPQRVHTASQYVTKDDIMDVINQLRKQTNRPSELDFTPPYPAHIRRQPYPLGYVEHPPQFPKYNGEKGNAREHIARFVESMSPWLSDDEVSNHNILLREFNKTLTDSAFSWYYNLEKGSVHDWDDMKLQFYKKFFYVQKQVTIVELMRFTQKPTEELSDYVDRFRTQAQKCVEPIEEKNLVSICNNGALDAFKPHLITKAPDSFSTLSSFAQDLGGIMSLPASHAAVTWKGKRSAIVALADSQQKPQGGRKERERKKGKPGDKYSGLPVPEAITCSEKAFKDLYEQWVEHGVVKPPTPRFAITEEMKRRPNFCVYHQYAGHSTMDCYSLRRIYHRKISEL